MTSAHPATRHGPQPSSLFPSCHTTLSSPSTLYPSEFIKHVRNQEWLPQYFLIIHRPFTRICGQRWPNPTPASNLRWAGHCGVSLCLCTHCSESPANFGSLRACLQSWPRGHRVPCFSGPLLQEWKIAGNVYLSLSIQEITCKEMKRPTSADTIISAPSNTSWFRPRREGPYSTSELLHFLPHKAEGGGVGGWGWTAAYHRLKGEFWRERRKWRL